MTRPTVVALSALAFAGALAVTLLVAEAFFGIPRADSGPVGGLLALVGGIVTLGALVFMRPAILGRAGGVRAQLAGASLVAILLLLAMVLSGARAMFLSAHDLSVLLTMLLFAALLAVGLSLLWSASFAGRIERLRQAAGRLAHGDLEAGLVVEGHDEIAALAGEFNRMAAALRQAAERERAVEQSRRDLVAAVSHDLRTPISAARALLEAVADGVVEDPSVEARYLAAAQGEIRHLGQLVDDLFELAQIDAGLLRITLERASLSDLISDTLAGFHARAEQQGVHLEGAIEGEVDPVLVSPPKIQRVLRNLVDNALRHTPADGTILIRAAADAAVVRVEVADSGEGIAPDDLPHVFERSFRAERSRTRARTTRTGVADAEATGAGLGLTIARGLIEAHGGQISVESEPGQGTRFQFTLQRA
ncbi:MAG TPA: HAMP domain-containing sensor histidine kinase [Thermomicrobiaceae bacterium]|nr:HAMP domain-containing sensor histidine kinase [Thermomicrobiaceae bacterium]